MKTCPKWYAEMILYPCLSLIFALGIISLSSAQDISYLSKIVGNVIFIVLFAVFAFVTCLTYAYETKYYEEYYLPTSLFNIQKYENILVISMEDFAWTYTYQVDKILALHHILCVKEYTKNKKPNGFQILPYEQLTGAGKKKYARYLESQAKRS